MKEDERRGSPNITRQFTFIQLKCKHSNGSRSLVTYHHVCRILLVTQSPGTIWEGTTQEFEYQEIRIIRGSWRLITTAIGKLMFLLVPHMDASR